MNEPTIDGNTVTFPKQWQWLTIHGWCEFHKFTIRWWQSSKHGEVMAHGAFK